MEAALFELGRSCFALGSQAFEVKQKEPETQKTSHPETVNPKSPNTPSPVKPCIGSTPKSKQQILPKTSDKLQHVELKNPTF